MKNFQSSLNQNSLFEILRQSNDATAIYTSADLVIGFVNDAMLKIWGKNSSVHGLRFEDAIPEMEEQPFTQLLKNVWINQTEYNAVDTPATLEINGEMVTSYFDFTYKPIFDENGNIFCILHTAADVTERFKARELVHNKEIREKEITEELKIANRDFQITNNNLNKSIKDLDVLNTDYIDINKKLEEANQKINFLNSELKKENTSLLFDNNELEQLNKTIQQLNTKLTESEESFSHLIQQAPVATLLVKGHDFKIQMINKSMLNLLGKDKSIIGKKLFEVLPELRGQRAANMLIESFEKGISLHDFSNPVFIHRHGSLEKGFFNFTYTPFIENGKVTGVIDMAMEVTPQVLAIQEKDETIREKTILEETLRENEQRLQGILETMAEGVCVIDAEGKLMYVNPMAQQILGLQERSLKSRTYDNLKWNLTKLDGSPLSTEEHPMTLMLQSVKPIHDHEIAIQRPDGQMTYISVNAAPIFDDNGTLTGGIGTFMDVTARRMVIQGKDDFISIASHELKTPVTALKATLQLLQRSHKKLSHESREKLLFQSNKSLEKLSSLLINLLDATRLEQGHLQLEKKSFVIYELFDDCCDNLKTNENQKIIFKGNKQQILEADHQQIGRVMTNFITNAIKYAPLSETIIVNAQKLSDSEFKISVKDTGPGIPKEKLKYLFERYYRAEYKGQKFSGLGLGLYISADIIKNHGGKIGVESSFGNGSEFWFTLPI
ncbi:PAS domain S-box protein [Chryseobacterium sp.]|uniref:PAS domain S-box protein n=1 Tax=Chryseobacterium sp. TaxID=1871047 RepID=UPI00289F8ACA|nr:PAS domain S-box protein [Chryseobacterium sp.]